jgi:hypothetical protein
MRCGDLYLSSTPVEASECHLEVGSLPPFAAAGNSVRVESLRASSCLATSGWRDRELGTAVATSLDRVAWDPSWTLRDGATATTRENAWLGRRNVASVAQRVCATFLQDADPLGIAHLVCALAEWQRPRLHPPHRLGHPGAHPLEGAIRLAVRLADRRTDEARTPNTQVQAQSRLTARVEDLFGAVGEQVHAEQMSL